MKDINPITESKYLEEYEQWKMYMEIVAPKRLAEYFNSLVELREIDYDIMLYGKERMLIFFSN